MSLIKNYSHSWRFVVLIILFPALASAAGRYPFIGQWDCEVDRFTFTNKTYNNGSKTLRIKKIEKSGTDFRLTFNGGYSIVLLDVKQKTMLWESLESGDAFKCRRIK